MSIISDVFKREAQQRKGVQRTPELTRILNLPRRRLDLDAGTVDGQPILDLTPLYLTNGSRCSEYPRCALCASGKPVRMWPAQSAALLEAERGWGLFGPLGVGSGKTLVTLLLPDVFDSKSAALLVPAQLRDQLKERDIPDYGRHFRLPIDRITVIAYSELSIAQHADVLEQVRPDLVIADEAHGLARIQSARTKRFLRFMKSNPGTRFCAVSGTMTRRSLRDYAGLCELALRAGSPVPGRWSDLQEWADALDPIPEPIPVGALRALAEGDPRVSQGIVGGVNLTQEAVREGFRKRLVDTPGVVATAESWEGASLVVRALPGVIPPSVNAALVHLRKFWEIGGEELESAARLAEVVRYVSLGFYYRWLWPDGVPDVEWLTARADWHKRVREILKLSREGMDSPMLVARAAKRGDLGDETSELLCAWDAVRGRHDPHPPIETVWIDEFAIRRAVQWWNDEKEPPAIIWYRHDAIGRALSTYFPVYGAGTDAGTADPNKDGTIACSILAQSTGKNLQRYSRNLVIEPPASGATTEQLIGRTHRPGQTADEVTFDVFAHTPELLSCLDKAIEDARYVESTQGARQKLLLARRIGW